MERLDYNFLSCQVDMITVAKQNPHSDAEKKKCLRESSEQSQLRYFFH